MTIVDIAKATGYSLGTVSRALNHQPNVSAKARKIILDYAEKAGYEMNASAQSLAQRSSRGVLALVCGRSNELFARMIEHMQELFAPTDTSLSVAYVDEDENVAQAAIRLCREKKPEGLLLLGGALDEKFAQVAVPTVLITGDASTMPFENLSSVTTDDFAAGRDAVGYLLSHGHRRIAVLTGDGDTSCISELRYAGACEAVRSQDLDPEEVLVRCFTRFSYRGGYRTMQELMGEHPDVTAVFAVADVVAIGAMRAAFDAGKHVPEELSFIGFDGIEISSYCNPKLTTIAQSADLIARRSVEILRQQIEHKAPRREQVAYQLIERESVRALL